MNLSKSYFALSCLLALFVICLGSVVQADRSGWEQQEVDWLAGPGGRIKSIRYPVRKSPPLITKPDGRTSITTQKDDMATGSTPGFRLFSQDSAAISAVGNIIDSPPIAGFTPYIAVAVTDKRSDDFDWVAQTHTSVVGKPLTSEPETNFTIGLLDTGASAHIMSYSAAIRAGIYSSGLITDNTTEISGATHSVFARVSQPLGVFMDGLEAIGPNAITLDNSNMVGQSNVAIIVGDVPAPNEPELPSVIGSPMSVNFVTTIYNDNQITVTYDGNDYTSPAIRFYDHSDPRIPDLQNRIPLRLIPAGAVNIQYIPSFDSIYDFVFEPGTPSIIIGTSVQSLFFVSSLDLHEGTKSAIDKTRFMLDTGAQVTVIGSDVAARLGFNPAVPEFEVEIQDVTGSITVEPGFYIDSLEIAVLGEWLSFTNIPVVMLDVSSPEGGYLDGIIGMNLFTEFNLVLRGGGLLGQAPPALEFELIPARLIADIAPDTGDGIVDFQDFAVFAQSWLSTSTSPNWNPRADLSPLANPDGVVDIFDLVEFADHWLDTTAP